MKRVRNRDAGKAVLSNYVISGHFQTRIKPHLPLSLLTNHLLSNCKAHGIGVKLFLKLTT